jgi:hypothetical protein
MIDAQAKGLATRVRALGNLNYYSGNAWQSQALEQICALFTLLEAFKNIATLSPEMQEDVRTLVGWNQAPKELLEDPTAQIIKDDWLVIARKTTVEEDITVQRNWLYGCTSQRYALILGFSVRGSAIEIQLMPGMLCKANIAYFKGNMPFRAIVKAQSDNTSTVKYQPETLPNWEHANIALNEQRKKNFWADDIPQHIQNLTLVKHQHKWYLIDSESALMPLNPAFTEHQIWHLLIASSGQPINLFLLRTNDTVLPLGFLAAQKYHLL